MMSGGVITPIRKSHPQAVPGGAIRPRDCLNEAEGAGSRTGCPIAQKLRNSQGEGRTNIKLTYWRSRGTLSEEVWLPRRYCSGTQRE